LATELIVLLLLIIANGVFAMSEVALISARRARLQQRAEEGEAGAAAALALSEEPTRFLSTVQVGITLIGILSGALGGSALAARIQPGLAAIPLLAPYADALSLALVVLGITYLSLVIGELVPKRLALNDAEGIAAAVARPMNLLSRLTSPIVSLLSLSTRGVIWLLRAQPSDEPPVTEDEVRIMLEEGAEAGVFEAVEQRMAERVFWLDDLSVGAVMTPYPEIVWLDIDAPLADNLALIRASRHSVYPVFQDEERNLLGVIKLKDLWLTDQPAWDLRAALHPPVYIPETTTALRALELFRKPDQHLAVVIDEHGGIAGVLTALDILEVIIGDVASTDSPQAVMRADGSWLVDGSLSITELEETLDTDTLFPDDERHNYQTVSGFVMLRLGRIPQAADWFEWGGFRFEVVDMDGRRVDKVLIARRNGSNWQ
jgi:putative hemolysin